MADLINFDDFPNSVNRISLPANSPLPSDPFDDVLKKISEPETSRLSLSFRDSVRFFRDDESSRLSLTFKDGVKFFRNNESPRLSLSFRDSARFFRDDESLGILNISSLIPSTNETSFLKPDQMLLPTSSKHSDNKFDWDLFDVSPKIYQLPLRKQSCDLSQVPQESFEMLTGSSISPVSSVLNRGHIFKSSDFYDSPDIDQGENKLRCSVIDVEDNDFNDSVFIEAHHMASKIADGSILQESLENILNLTPQPDWCDEVTDEPEKDIPKWDAETIRKKIDIMFPPTQSENLKATKLKCKTKTNSTENNSTDDEKTSQNSSRTSSHEKDKNDSKLIEYFNNTNKGNNTTRSNGSSNSRDAKEMLENLSKILSNSRRSDIQKSEGKQLLFDLAEMLYDSDRFSNLDDSGHSSIIADGPMEDQENCEVQKLRRSKSITDKPTISSPKLKNNNRPSLNSRISRSFSTPSTTFSNSLQQKTGYNSSESQVSQTSNNSSKNSVLGRNSSRTLASGNCKRFPLKALLPIEQMSKKNTNGQTTPTKSTECNKKAGVMPKRTSTPINESKLKPMAQSTPTLKFGAKKVPMKKIPAATPPPALPLLGRQRSNSLGSNLLKLKGTVASSSTTAINSRVPKLGPSRRNSVSDMRKNNLEDNKLKSKPHIKPSGLMSVLNQVKQNINKSINDSGHKNSASKITPQKVFI